MRTLRLRFVGNRALLMALVTMIVPTCAADAQVKLLWQKSLGQNVVGAELALSTSGERLAVLTGWGIRRETAQPAIVVFSSAGDVLWKYTAPETESLGGLAITPDGQRVFCDYWTKPRVIELCPEKWPDGTKRDPGEGGIMPSDKVAYSGGIYCFGPTGVVQWKTTEEAVEIGSPVSAPLGSVQQATSDRLLVVRPGEECEWGAGVLDFSGRIVLRREFTQDEQVQRVVLSPDGRSVLVGWRDRLGFTDIATGATAEVKGFGLAEGGGAMSVDGKLLLVRDPTTSRFGLADAGGNLKWTHRPPKSWPDSIVASSGAFAGQTMTVAHWPLLGAGPQGASLLLVRGARRVLFRFPPSSYVPQQVELPAVEYGDEHTFLSPDGTVVAITRQVEAPDGSGRGPLRVIVLQDTGALLGELELPEWRFANRLPLGVEFSNPATHMALSAGPDLYFIQVTP